MDIKKIKEAIEDVKYNIQTKYSADDKHCESLSILIQTAEEYLKFKERMSVEQLFKTLYTTKLGEGHNFSDGTNFDLFLKDWKVKRWEILLLARAIKSLLDEEV